KGAEDKIRLPVYKKNRLNCRRYAESQELRFLFAIKRKREYRKEETKMRTMEFKMERPGLIEEGQEAEITELQALGGYSYLIEPSVAMSGLYKSWDRLKSRKGTVKEIKETDRGYYVTMEFQE